tara:strand:- start:1239 stop:1616 length:378 start_codon:yes stop_codon:yes gene_type:complete
MCFTNLIKNELNKTIGKKLPQEMINEIMKHYEYPRKVLCNEIKRKGKSCFDNASNRLIDMIADTGTFQEGHFETVGKRHEISTVRKGAEWSPLDLKVKIISRYKVVEVYQTKDIRDWDFDVDFVN